MDGRRRFNQLFEELSVEIGRLAPRYALWLRVQESGVDPEAMSHDDLLEFVDRALPGFLDEQRVALAPRGLTRLRRRLARFDARHATPYETMERLGSPLF